MYTMAMRLTLRLWEHDYDYEIINGYEIIGYSYEIIHIWLGDRQYDWLLDHTRG